MRFVQIEQNTPGWLEWRRGGLGASDATTIAGVPVPWPDPTTPRRLWELKTGRARGPDSTYAQRRGQRLEPVARRLYEATVGRKAAPCCVEHARLPWLRASLDGLSPWGDLAVEIKAPRRESHVLALQGRVPDYYVPQLLHQCAASGAAAVDYVSYSEAREFDGPRRMAVVRFTPDPAEVARLVALESAFWARVVFDWWPPDEAAA